MRAKDIIKIYIVEDDIYYNRLLTKYLNNLSKIGAYANYEFDIKTFYGAFDFLKKLEKDVDIILLDYYLNGETKDKTLTGLDVLREIKERCEDCKVIIISGQQNMITTVELLRNGAYDYVVKDENSLNRAGAIVQKIISEKMTLGQD